MGSHSPVAGKRILVLGAGPYQLPVIQRALDLGCHVIAADYLPGNPGHRLASASAIVTTVDAEAVLRVAREHRIDAVLTYGSDVSVPSVAYVAEQMGLPGNPLATAALLQRKDRIRELQRDLGLPHPRFAAGTSPGALLAAAPFPLLVKPADSSGSKGQSVATAPEDLAAAFARAREFSRCGVVVAEEVLPEDTTELVCEALVQDGRLVFGHYGHNWFCSERHPRVPAGEIVPGAFGAEVIAEIDRQLSAIVAGAGVRSACMNCDALLSRGEVVLLDLGLRSGGNLLPEVVRRSTGVDLTTAAILMAAGVSVDVPALHAPEPRCVVSQIIHSHLPGTFREVRVEREVEESLVSLDLFVAPGARVAAYDRGDAGIGVATFEVRDVAAAFELIRCFRHPCSVAVDPD